MAGGDEVLNKISVWIDRPEEIVYRSCYAPVDLNSLLTSAETRSKIRRLSLPPLFFGLQELDDQEVAQLLPHATEEQWRGVLDLALWSRDRALVGDFIRLQRHLLSAEDAVARKLFRASDPLLWELTFRRHLDVRMRLEEDEYEEEPDRERDWMVTPDNDFLIGLPEEPEKARLLRAMLARLYQLDPQMVPVLLRESRSRTSAELEESAYQERRRRMEDLGFQDYFDAIAVYTPWDERDRLPEKSWTPSEELSLAPVPVANSPADALLLFSALANVTDPKESNQLLEELFFVANRVLSADRVSPADAKRVKQGIRKAVTGINFGLDRWSGGDRFKAAEGIRRHYLQNFFQIGYGRLLQLRRQARLVQSKAPPPPGSLDEALVESLSRRYPMMVLQTPKRLLRRLIRTEDESRRVQKRLDQLLPSA